jgi:serine phosphatase RsbU (regulator of sigma subunit)
MKISFFIIRSAIVVLTIISLQNNISAQKGYPYISAFTFNESIENDNSDIIQDENQNILIANRKGILTFDSRNWDLLPLPYYPVVLAKSPYDGSIYTGCRNGFGLLEQDLTGKYTYSLLSDTIFTGEISDIRILSNKEFFMARNRIYFTSRDDESCKFWDFPYEHFVSGSFVFNDEFYFMLFDGGLYKAENDTFKLISSDRLTTRTELLFAVETDSRNIIVGNNDNEVYLFNGTVFSKVNLNDAEYLKASIITDGAYLGATKIAIGSLMGGVLICDYESGETFSIINYKTGLPDDEVYCLGIDNNYGLWLCHSYGLSRIDNNINVTNLTWYSGLSGNLTNAAWFRNQLYIGTSDGLYTLKENREYRERQVYVNIDKQINEPAPAIKSESVKTETISKIPETTKPAVAEVLSKKEQRKKRRGNNTEISSESATPAIQQAGILSKIDNSADNSTRSFVKKTVDDAFSVNKKRVYSLQSISHSYEKISGITGKCTEIISCNEHLIVSTNNGLYDIFNNQVYSVIPDAYINFINPGPHNTILFAGTEKSLYILLLSDNRWEVVRELDALDYPVYSACMTSSTELWLGSDNSAHKLTLDSDYYIENDIVFPITTRFSDKVNLKTINKQLYFFLSAGIYRMENDEIKEVKAFSDLSSLPGYYFSENNVVCYRSSGQWNFMADNISGISLPDDYLNIFQSVQDIFVEKSGTLWIIANDHEIFKIQKETTSYLSQKFSVFFSGLKGKDDKLFPLNSPKLSYDNSSLRIEFSAPYYLAPGKTEFTYKIEELSNIWSPWTNASAIEYPMLPPGKYSIQAKARNIFGEESEISQLDIVIKPPFWRTALFYIIIIILIFSLFGAFVKVREQTLKRDKQILEQKVQERTLEIECQKNEISEQKKEITDSIFYAKRIQTAVLPSTKMLNSVLPDHFVLFLPKDIVSGDFYWSTIKGDKIVLLAADCTGHGVPGAFMSMLGISFLNEIVSTHKLDNAGTLLDELREHVKTTLAKSENEVQARDGMDIALCIIDQKQMKMQFAGAYNPLYMIRDKELAEIKGDKMPVGSYDLNTGFSNNVVNLKKNDCFYIFSDGYIDQFGGEDEKKFLSRQFKSLLTKNHDQPMNKQKESLVEAFETWKGKLRQIDDVLVIGFRI